MFRKVFWIVVFLVATNLATFFWGEMRLGDLQGECDRRLETSSRVARERQMETDELRRELDRLEAWGHLVDFQEELRQIDTEIEHLNYGNALERLNQLEERIDGGAMGALLEGSSPDLDEEFEAVRSELQAMSSGAASQLRVLARSTFDSLSGFAAEIEERASRRPIGERPRGRAEPDERGHTGRKRERARHLIAKEPRDRPGEAEGQEILEYGRAAEHLAASPGVC